MKPLVYLAGPITDLSYGGATDWRIYAYRALKPWGITTLSPMRAKTYLKNESKIGAAYEEHPLSSAIGINIRDINDVRRCDAVLMNFAGASDKSAGTLIELGAATALQKPVVMVMEDPQKAYDQVQDNQFVVVKNPHEHPMVRGFNLVVKDLDTAIECIAAFLSTDDHWNNDAPAAVPATFTEAANEQQRWIAEFVRMD